MVKKKGVKKRLFFNFFQAHKKIATCLVIGVGFLGFFFAINYGRYVKDVIQLYYLRSQNFYFSSDKLTITGKNYEINPWGGTLDYSLNISMSSLLNSIKGTSENIIYDVTCQGDNKVDCYIDTLGTRTVRRTLDSEDHADNFTVTVTPRNNVNFTNGEKVKVSVKAKSVSPYVEELTATFELVIGDYGMNFEIEDEPGNVYFDTLVTNTRDTKRAKVTLTIHPDYIDEIYFDMTNPVQQQNNFTSSTSVVTIDNVQYNYITEVSFIIEPKSSLMVKYFKHFSQNDNSYVLGDLTKTPVIIFETQDID